jgi:hypothetical protein
MRHTCEQCGGKFDRKLAGSRPIRFCSGACYHAWRKDNGIVTGAFKPGFTPWNKNLKGIHLSPASEFKRGHDVNEVYELGTVTERRGRKGRVRQHVKTPDGWVEYAKWLWIEHYGRLILGDVVHHLNGQHLDDRIENLIALPRQDHPIYHNRWGLKSIPADRLAYYHSRYGRLAQNFLPFGAPAALALEGAS